MEVGDILDGMEEMQSDERDEKDSKISYSNIEKEILKQTILDSVCDGSGLSTKECETIMCHTILSDKNFVSEVEEEFLHQTCQTPAETDSTSKTILDACELSQNKPSNAGFHIEGINSKHLNETILNKLEIEANKSDVPCSDKRDVVPCSGVVQDTENVVSMEVSVQNENEDTPIINTCTNQEHNMNKANADKNKEDVYNIDNDLEENYSQKPSDRKLTTLREYTCMSFDHKTAPNPANDNMQTNLLVQEVDLTAGDTLKLDKPSSDLIQKIVYIYSKELVEVCDQMQKIPKRASMVHSLIEGYGLTRYMRIVESRKAKEEEVTTFHDPDYVDFLKKMEDQDDTEKFENDAIQYGLTYDCPLHRGVYNYATMTTGATLMATECLLQGKCRVAINWCGGWHHAAKDHAAGFCYINDIVVGILKLKEKYSRILYVDLDLHHGDGVEDAFCATSKVMTVSFHKFAPGFFPGTGSVKDIGIGKGQYYTVNVPLLDGIRDTEFTPLVCRILNKVKEKFHPEVVVCQCGADGLAGDPMESFNLTHKGLGKCVYFLLQWNLPTLLLGGGGYSLTNTARCWAYLTALAAGKQLPSDIPDHQYLMEYGPDYDLEIQSGNRKNHNTAHYLRQVYGIVMSNLSKIS